MSDNANPTDDLPTTPAAPTGADSAAVPPRPPLPDAGSPYASQQPYTAPQPRGEHAPSGAFGAAGHPTEPTRPYAPAAHGSNAPAAHGSSAPAATAHAAGDSGRVGAGRVVAIMVAAALVGGAAGLGGSAAGMSLFEGGGTTIVSPGAGAVTINDEESVNQVAAIAAKAMDSVVTISASAGSGGGTGSGVILTEDGYVVTNTHVVTLDGATSDAELTVTTADGKVYRAEIVGTDPTYDLAVIKLVDAEGLTPIEFGDSGKLNVGDQTVAIGAPLGLSNTVTTGIVSALNRSIQIASSAVPDGPDEQEDAPGGESPFQFDFGQGQQQQQSTGTISIAVIQTDAAINPGNSGGALLDSTGKLIGINVAIATAGGSSSDSNGSIGVGFSIPADVVQRVADEIIEDGSASHGLLGAMVGDAAAQQNATTAGAYISDVTSGGAAAEAGLRQGDVVTSFNGLPITNATDLTAQVRALAAGSTAEVVYEREGQTRTTEVTLGELTQ
jgi:putative serine protease PepD